MVLTTLPAEIRGRGHALPAASSAVTPVRPTGGHFNPAVTGKDGFNAAVFVWVILGATSRKAPPGFGPLAIGMALTLIHLISIPVTNTSVNPARSLGVAWFAGADAMAQVWLFIAYAAAQTATGALIAGYGS